MEETLRTTQKLCVGGLNVEVYANREDMGAAAARAAAARIRETLVSQGHCRIVFAAAPSQNEFLAELGRLPDIDWSQVTAFHMDEYVGLANDHPQSFVRFLREHLWAKVRPGSVHPLNGLNPDPEAECRRYSELLAVAPIDMLCAGIGENGHLAFNDPPHADFEDRRTLRVVALAERSREQQVHDGCFPALEAVPTHALTLTIPALMTARVIYCMVPGPTKAEAMRDTLTGLVRPECPATILRRHPDAVLYGDAASCVLAPFS
jgi:glucosamine-6-phosphate deaminase